MPRFLSMIAMWDLKYSFTGLVVSCPLSFYIWTSSFNFYWATGESFLKLWQLMVEIRTFKFHALVPKHHYDVRLRIFLYRFASLMFTEFFGLNGLSLLFTWPGATLVLKVLLSIGATRTLKFHDWLSNHNCDVRLRIFFTVLLVFCPLSF